jgi:spermidine synthase
MIPWIHLGSATIPGDGGTMTLHRRGDEFAIRVGPHELMNSRVYGSEEALARLACEHMADLGSPRVLIGGLGMGFTLAEVLHRVGKGASVAVAELVPEVVDWNRSAMAELNGAALEDDRVEVRTGDVARIIRAERNAWDAILLDFDNGPSALTSRHNDRLYSANGLIAAHTALRPGGLLAVWSAGADPSFTRRLQRAGFDCEEIPARARGRAGGSRFLIWIARRRR